MPHVSADTARHVFSIVVGSAGAAWPWGPIPVTQSWVAGCDTFSNSTRPLYSLAPVGASTVVCQRALILHPAATAACAALATPFVAMMLCCWC